MSMIDLRSDTVTVPSQAMRDAMYKAEVGDDVYGEDPTVNRLQEVAAERLGKQSALFVPSGTMGNLIALLTHCGRGHDAIVGDKSHIVLHEQGGAAALGGITCRPVRNQEDGSLDLEEIASLINLDDDIHVARTRLVCLENTWNGRVLPLTYMSRVAELTRKHKLLVHLDGARIFNAAVALKQSVSKLVADADTVQFCCSKGLAAPVGSLLCGDVAFINEARRNRKLVGGGMRQAGVIAAACLVALEHMVDRLADDHANAKKLAQGLAECPGIEVDPSKVDTNIVLFSLSPTAKSNPNQVCELLSKNGLHVLPLDHKQIRAVTHFGIEAQDIDKALSIINSVMKSQMGMMATSSASR